MRRRYYSFRGAVGSALYHIIYIGIFLLGITFFGTSMLDGIVLAIVGVISFKFVGIILRRIGFWRY